MYRGRPPPRGGYPPPFEGRGPPPPRPYPAPGYRDDRSRPRPPYHSGYHEHGPPDPYRRSPPRRRYPSPGSGSHRGGEYRAGAPPTERPPSPRGTVPLDHNLVITVGNELTGPSGSALLHHLDRPEYEAIRGRSRPRSRSPDRSRARSLGRSKSRPRSQSRSPDRSRAKSRGRSRSRSPDRSRAKSRGRSRSRSLDRSRAKSRGRSRSRSPEQTRAKSRGRSPDRSRAKSRGHSRSRSPDRSRAKSRGRSRSRPCSRSKSRSRSRSRSRGRSRGRSYSKGPSYAQSKSRRRSRNRSCSGSSSSSLSSRSRGDAEEKANKGFKELEMARRRKELEELLTLPTKSILKKRNSEDSPSIRSTDSPRALDGSMSQLADQLLQAVKGTDPRMVASMLAELRSDPQMARRAGLDAEIKEILNLLGETTPGTRAQEKVLNDIDDEERFLYGDSEDPKSPPAPEPVLHHSLDLYGDVTEEALYNDYPPQKPATAQTYGRPLQAPSSMDVSYVSRPTINPDQNITVQVPNPSYPPGTEPLAESDRQSLEEYEKIQDLLKTIGVDLGVAEITKMAARTKERLHGSKPPPKTPTRRRQYSPDSSDGSQRGHRTRSHSGSSSSTSRSRSHGRGGSATGWNSDEDDHRKASAPPKSHKDRDIKERKGEYSDAAPLPSQTPDLSSHPPHPGVPIPTYPPSQVPGMMPPNYPPPGYGQYGNYLPYMPQQWPPMYPPPNIRMPPPTDAEEYPPPLPYKQAYTPEQGVKGSVKSVAQDPEKESSKALRVSEEQNNESQKQKVLVERENLKQEREIRMKKKEYLMKELERLRKQQGELLRKKRREKDGHKDPLLQEISHLQEEVMAQISNLRKEHEAAEKKRHEIEKVALILGLSPSDRPRRSAKPPEVPEAEPQTPPQKKKREAERSPDSQRVASGPTVKGMSATRSPSRASPDKTPVTAPAPTTPPEPFEYYDAGNHWCKNCNATCGSMFDFFTHLHSKTHRKTLDPYDRPWASTPGKISKNLSSEEKLTKPAKGSEFLLPIRGFFCLLCREFYGDAICAEEHVTTHAHNEKYKKQMYENPLYEQRRNLDRQAGLALEASAKKRKHDDDERGSKEDKTKHKKEKKEKEKKKEEDVPKEEKFKMKKEEEEDKLKLSKTEEDSKNASSLEKEWPSYSKKDEGEKYKYCKKDDKYRYSREEEERDSRYRYSREEEYRYRYDRDEDDRYSDRPKYGPKDDKDKYKGGKCSDFRSKYETERDEGKPKAEREGFKNEQEKLAVSKPELPPKPYDLPKILCGPSPAMRAKLRKQSLEAGKPAPPATTTFGKFMWKKKENMLAKEAEKVAAEFIKEDEAAAKEKPVSAEDSFAKSMAVAKEIAEKLGSQPSIAAPWMSNRGRIRPNLPTPAVGLRKPTTMGRPASLNTFLSIRPQSTSLLGPPPVLPSAPTSFGNGLLQTKPIPPVNRPGPFEAMRPPVHKPALFQVRPPPPVSVLELSKVKPTPPPISELTPIQSGEATTPTQSEVNPASPVSEPATVESEPAPAEPKLLKSFEVNPAPPVSKPSPVDLKPVPVEAKPLPSSGITATPAQPAMIKIVSDVAAPGVPESEQIHTVFVKPPPFMKKSEVQKSDKFKRNLAAAKAQDLFDIFYSSVGQTGPSSFSKLASDSRTEGSSVGKSSCPIPQIPSNPQLELQRKPQPEPQSQLQSQPHSEPQSQPHPEPQCQPQLEPQSQPHAEPQPQLKPELESLPQSQSQAVIQFPPPTDVQKCPQRDPDEHPQSPLTPTNSGIQIASVWSLQSSKDSTSKLTLPNETDTQTAQPRLPPPPQFEVHIAPQNQSLTAKSDCQISPESQSAELQSQHKPASEIQTELQSEPDPNKDIQSYPEPQSLAESEHKPKPGPKIRGKTTPTKKTPSAPRPTRQTRSQTRYQTRQQQQQNQPEPEPGSASGDTAASDPKSLDTEDPGSGLRTEAVGPSEEDPQMMEITAETLGLPSDMTSLDFEYDFNFE
ncbi:LOW QUALITY PROTEIN: zinc finger protein 318 [Archocentrus centrarchus]|uniref:LOW QUALITY PROTEIN: zinc finger protein 318 n=1 Tax=Archocentrus centrarchus TaxID=63155 RepID=UPI0011EA1A95|nr:LOW QUALITY PROTEIN: zinc finger protein 318 [Archocentrus centrarchus]